MVHLGPERMRSIYQGGTVFLNTSMVVSHVIGLHSSELIPKLKVDNYLLKGVVIRLLNAGIDILQVSMDFDQNWCIYCQCDQIGLH